jgi:hypothetical protein
MQMAGPDGPSLWICAAVIGLRKEKYGNGHAILQVSENVALIAVFRLKKCEETSFAVLKIIWKNSAASC